ncbi:hypothetical protein DFH06DRAFT_1419737 [Mycena polygramma]|nr:hypothetical protein DFH06DRAFT_1419737 [Mycena polygramma]
MSSPATPLPAVVYPALPPSPSNDFITKVAPVACGSRGYIVRRLLVALSSALSNPPPTTSRPMRIPPRAEQIFKEASPATIAILHFRGQGVFQSMVSQVIREAVPYPLNSNFTITAIRDFVKSEHGLGVIMRRLSPGNSTVLFTVVLGVLKAMSRAVCLTWLRMVLRPALSALSVEGVQILATVPDAAAGAHKVARDKTAVILNAIATLHSEAMKHLPGDEPVPATAEHRRWIKPLPRHRLRLPLEDNTNTPLS